MPKTTHFAPETCTLCPRQCRADRAAGQNRLLRGQAVR